MKITESDDPQGSFQNLQVQNFVFYLYVKGGEEDRERKRRKERIRRGGRGILGQGEQGEEKRIGQSDKQQLLSVTRYGLGTGILINELLFSF